MASEWSVVPLAELVEDILDRRGVTPVKLGSAFTSSGHRVISAKVVKSGRIDLSADEPRFIDTSTYERWMRTPLAADDVIITSEAPLGELAYLREPKDWALGQRLFAIRTDKRLLHGRFLYYALQSEAMIHELQSRATGTTAQGIRQSELRRVMVPLPPPSEQRRIAAVLGALDDKIELNRSTNETLEAIARAVFRSWFVDFDPVLEKSEGFPPHVPPHIASLFPGSLEDSELGPIPLGWKVRPFLETVHVVGGGTPKTSVAEYWNGEIPWFSIADAPAISDVWVVNTEKTISRIGVENSSTQILPVGTTILSARGTVGRVALSGVPMAMNQSCYGLRPRTSSLGYYTYFASRELVTILRQHAHGSVFDTITQSTLGRVRVIDPPQALVDAFNVRVGPLLDRMRVALLASRTLGAARDAILPEVVSGRVRVPSRSDVTEVET